MLLLLGAHYFTKINGMLIFWIAFILCRSTGAPADRNAPTAR